MTIRTIIEVNTLNKSAPKRRRGKKLPKSAIIDRKGRKIGSDDMMEGARLCKWAEHSGLRSNLVPVANMVGIGLETAVQLALKGQHREAGKKVQNVLYVLNKETNEAVANIKVDCRDSRIRQVKVIAKWFAGVHLRIADEIDTALAEEAERELERLQRRAFTLAAEEAADAAETTEVKVA